MKYRILAAAVLLLILIVGVLVHTDTPAPTAPQGSSQPASKEDEAMRNLKIN